MCASVLALFLCTRSRSSCKSWAGRGEKPEVVQRKRCRDEIKGQGGNGEKDRSCHNLPSAGHWEAWQHSLAQLHRETPVPQTCNPSSHHWFHRDTTTMSDCKGPKENLHRKARTSPYPGSKVERTEVPDDKVDWLINWKNYSPVDYTAPSVLAGPKWADPEIEAKNFFPRFNEKDGQVERRSHSGLYKVENGRPRNPIGRTGLVGRGLLGRWGPNHAADPLITRWKRDGSGNKTAHPVSGKNILQFIAIKRKDCGEWAIPGGMVDPGEKLSAALKREFSEEALNSLQKTKAEKEEMEKHLNRLFNQELFVAYKGYVDDPRNTDNAWMETEAVNYHDESGQEKKWWNGIVKQKDAKCNVKQ
ncbi:ADP-ribose pyrophosphatase, mitochondrial isoform X2 [Crotalus tigris]|uniref:ADP-ribose pyrophosphatase, mitochondrial isoform X2 n=1 Tax=Crotalus tigris TaxID=88082 RepID=UPI00192F293A|nr:ADP-ribose pyrophosphatase, mitochondrial isoform X2 [Crotalus tigris]